MTEAKHGVTHDDLVVRVPTNHPAFSWPRRGEVSQCPDGDAIVFVINELSDAQLASLGIDRPKRKPEPAPAPAEAPKPVQPQEPAPAAPEVAPEQPA